MLLAGGALLSAVISRLRGGAPARRPAGVERSRHRRCEPGGVGRRAGRRHRCAVCRPVDAPDRAGILRADACVGHRRLALADAFAAAARAERRGQGRAAGAAPVLAAGPEARSSTTSASSSGCWCWRAHLACPDWSGARSSALRCTWPCSSRGFGAAVPPPLAEGPTARVPAATNSQPRSRPLKEADHSPRASASPTPTSRKVIRLMLPRLLGVAVLQISLIYVTILASLQGQSSVAALHNAFILMLLPLGVFAMSLGEASLPDLADRWARGDTAGFAARISGVVRYSLFLTLPAAVGLAVLAEPIVAVLFQRGAFDARATELTAIGLQFFAIGLVGHAAVEVLVRGFFAMQDTRTPRRHRRGFAGAAHAALVAVRSVVRTRRHRLGRIARGACRGSRAGVGAEPPRWARRRRRRSPLACDHLDRHCHHGPSDCGPAALTRGRAARSRQLRPFCCSDTWPRRSPRTRSRPPCSAATSCWD